MTNQNLKIGILEEKDFEKLGTYLNGLSLITRSRFAPHTFDLVTIREFYLPDNQNTGFIIENMPAKQLVSYAIIKKGYVPNDRLRLENYELPLYAETDCTFAPSVADDWQSKGLGNLLFRYIMEELQKQGVKRMILWGGVQALNERAVNFYLKHGFRKIGSFEKNGIGNFDMVLEL